MNPNDEYKPKTIYSEPDAEPLQQPEVYNSPTLNNVPYGAQPAPQPQSANSKKASNKTPLIAAGVVSLIAIIVVGVVLAMNSGNSANKATPQTNDADNNAVLQPAKPLELEQTSNALSQDLSGLDDEKDFPAASLEDKTLGL